MSLINEALKKAKQVQKSSTEAETGPQLRPAESQERDAQPKSLLGPITIGSAVIILLLLAAVWLQSTRPAATSDNDSVVARARPVTPVAEAPPKVSPPIATATPAIINKPTSIQGPAKGIAVPDTVVSPERQSVSVGGDSALQSGNQETNAVPIAASPPPLRLQAIVFSPTRPSAIINGETLFVGERIRDSKVVAITRTTATLVGSDRTNVLSLAK